MKNDYLIINMRMTKSEIKQHSACQPSSNKSTKIPPIVVEGIILDINKLRNKLPNYRMYFKFSKNSTLLFIDSKSNYNKRMNYMKTKATIDEETLRSQFHTYTLTTQKTHGYATCGLDHKPTTDEVQEALLSEYEIETTALYEMKASLDT